MTPNNRRSLFCDAEQPSFFILLLDNSLAPPIYIAPSKIHGFGIFSSAKLILAGSVIVRIPGRWRKLSPEQVAKLPVRYVYGNRTFGSFVPDQAQLSDEYLRTWFDWFNHSDRSHPANAIIGVPDSSKTFIEVVALRDIHFGSEVVIRYLLD